jgi:hypothetical protein
MSRPLSSITASVRASAKASATVPNPEPSVAAATSIGAGGVVRPRQKGEVTTRSGSESGQSVIQLLSPAAASHRPSSLKAIRVWPCAWTNDEQRFEGELFGSGRRTARAPRRLSRARRTVPSASAMATVLPVGAKATSDTSERTVWPGTSTSASGRSAATALRRALSASAVGRAATASTASKRLSSGSSESLELDAVASSRERAIAASRRAVSRCKSARIPSRIETASASTTLATVT